MSKAFANAANRASDEDETLSSRSIHRIRRRLRCSTEQMVEIDTSVRFEEIWSRCLARGLRQNPARRFLIMLICSGGPLRSADDMRDAARAYGHTITISAIYRLLKELEALAVVSRWSNGRGKARFGLAETRDTICIRTPVTR